MADQPDWGATIKGGVMTISHYARSNPAYPIISFIIVISVATFFLKNNFPYLGIVLALIFVLTFLVFIYLILFDDGKLRSDENDIQTKLINAGLVGEKATGLINIPSDEPLLQSVSASKPLSQSRKSKKK